MVKPGFKRAMAPGRKRCARTGGEGNGLAVKPAAQDMGVAAELPLPKSITDHHGFGEAGHRIARSVYASQGSLGAENLEIIETGAEHLDALGVIAPAQRRAGRKDDADVIENGGAIAQVLDFGHGHADVLGARAIQIVKDADQLLGMLERKRPQKHGIHHGEDGDVRADAEGQREHGDGGKSGSSQKAATGEAQVREGLFHPKDGALLAMELLGLLHAAVSAPSLNPRLIETHAAPLELIFEQRQMSRHFAIQLVVGAAAAEEIRELGRQPSAVPHGSRLLTQQLFDEAGQLAPALGFLPERFQAGFGDGVVFRFPAVFRLIPFALDPALLLQTNQGRIERALVELQQVPGNLFQPGGNAVSVPRAQAAKRAQDDEIERALQDLNARLPFTWQSSGASRK
jgi:hypothetical protein